ncbi:hypothetical protein FCM35_KLT05333 [Carex littledalei]|uniref:Uncharacterized protein n=1 Tax=Carex littledalei TaxID=544730 RepID=A0A833QZU1_9POAL|nr:hypothetical protein FCM35_KLT05333 [Carex littledalei]
MIMQVMLKLTQILGIKSNSSNFSPCIQLQYKISLELSVQIPKPTLEVLATLELKYLLNLQLQIQLRERSDARRTKFGLISLSSLSILRSRLSVLINRAPQSNLLLLNLNPVHQFDLCLCCPFFTTSYAALEGMKMEIGCFLLQ